MIYVLIICQILNAREYGSTLIENSNIKIKYYKDDGVACINNFGNH